MSKSAIFFDRDGTLCQEKGYINHPDRLELMAQTTQVLQQVRERGFKSVVVTNQAGVARGYFPQHVLEQTHLRLGELLRADGAELDGVYACHHHPSVGQSGFRNDCGCRKPRPGMLIRAAVELDIDLSRSFMVGDSFKDIAAGRAAGVRGTVLLRTGYGRGELLWKEPPEGVWPNYVADDLTDAWQWILQQLEEE